MTDTSGVTLPVTLPIPSSLPRRSVDRAMTELGLGRPEALDVVVSVTIYPLAVEVELIAEGPNGRMVRTGHGDALVGTHRVLLPIIEG